MQNSELCTLTCAFIITLGLGYFYCRGIYLAGRAAGYLDGRNFLIKRRMLLRCTVWVDGHPIDRAGAVWIETNDFGREDLQRVQALCDWENHSADPTSKRAE
jgi:hypothetical protein